MTEGTLRVLKIPVPNSPSFIIRVKGHVVEFLEFNAQIFKESNIVSAAGQSKAKLAVFIWALIIETEVEENHEFVMVHTGQDFPMMDADIRYVASTNVPIPGQFEEMEMHLFHAGQPELTDSMKEKLAKAEEEARGGNG